MKILSLSLIFTSLIVISAIGCDQADSGLAANDMVSDGAYALDENLGAVQAELGKIALEPVSTEEAAGLLYMREEEKLAHDVYAAMFVKWNLRPFTNISRSEQMHMDAILSLITRYSLIDPVGTNGAGIFKDAALQNLYTTLMIQGNKTDVDALKVGATIEEVDIVDLQKHLKENDNKDIALVYDNLMRGSRNHLRAFVKNLSARGIVYSPQFLSQTEYNAIIASGIERGYRGGRK